MHCSLKSSIRVYTIMSYVNLYNEHDSTGKGQVCLESSSHKISLLTDLLLLPEW